MGEALLWTSQVQTNITDVQKNTLPLTGKVQVQNLITQTSKNTFTLTGKISCHQLRAAHSRAQRWYLLDSLPDECSPWVELFLVLFRNVDVIDQVSFLTARY